MITIWNCFPIMLQLQQTLQLGRTITFDMGQLAKVSRFKMYQRRGNDPVNIWAYDHNNLKKYVIYGCEALTDNMYLGGEIKEDGIKYPTFEGWTKSWK